MRLKAVLAAVSCLISTMERLIDILFMLVCHYLLFNLITVKYRKQSHLNYKQKKVHYMYTFFITQIVKPANY